jgi:hypothetical protein
MRTDLQRHVDIEGFSESAEHAEREVRPPGFDAGKCGLGDTDPGSEFGLSETRSFTGVPEGDTGTELSGQVGPTAVVLGHLGSAHSLPGLCVDI